MKSRVQFLLACVCKSLKKNLKTTLYTHTHSKIDCMYISKILIRTLKATQQATHLYENAPKFDPIFLFTSKMKNITTLQMSPKFRQHLFSFCTSPILETVYIGTHYCTKAVHIKFLVIF